MSADDRSSQRKPSFLIHGKDGKTYLSVTFRNAADAAPVLDELNMVIELLNERLLGWYQDTGKPEYDRQYKLAELITDGFLPDGTEVVDQTKLLLEIPDNHIYHMALEELYGAFIAPAPEAVHS